ncbi:MAG: ribosome silencing factor [Candidatus Cloacimonadota bacterium]|nr:ribosome silencing factor [Candidatus Cloacimonadota bacterium]
MEKYSTKNKLDIIIQLAKEKKAEDLISLNVENVSSLTDRIIICSGDRTMHTRAIGKYIIEETKKMDMKMHHQEGIQNGTWILLDFGDVVMHIFDRSAREFYKLDELWKELAKKVEHNLSEYT